MKSSGNEIRSIQKVVLLSIALVLFCGIVAEESLGQTSSSGLMAYYNFDDDVLDHSGNGNHGTNHGATFIEGVKEQALSLNGIDNYFLAKINNSVPQSLTIEAWIYPVAQGVVFSELGSGAINSGWHESQMEVLSTGEIKVGFWTGGEQGISLGKYPFNNWYHVAMTFDNDKDNIKGYVNGNLESSTTLSKIYPTELWYAIGATDSTNLGSGSYFSGYVDEVRIYNRALSEIEIQSDMKEGAIAPKATSTTTETPHVLIFDSSNHYLGACDLTDTSTWTLDKDLYVNTFQIWYSWNSGETTVSFDIKKDGVEFASGEAIKGSCDPYQHQWCNGDYSINKSFPKGTYTAKVSSARQCKVPGGTGVVRLYGTQGDAAPPGGTPIPTTITPTSKKCEGTSPYLYIDDRTMDKGKPVEIPIMMCNANNLANMDLAINYDSSVLKIKDIVKGSLNPNAIFDWNEISPGKLKIAFASKVGASGAGSIAVMKFDVSGNTGARTTITGTVPAAANTDDTKITVSINPGTFTVGTSSTIGDCDGDGMLTEKDARMALQISVGKDPVNMCYDYNQDGKVDSTDAREMLTGASKTPLRV